MPDKPGSGEGRRVRDLHARRQCNAHLAYAKALEAQSDAERALYEAESTWLCNSVKPKEAAAARAISAKIFLAQKKTKEARQHRDEALKLDPESDAKSLQIP